MQGARFSALDPCCLGSRFFILFLVSYGLFRTLRDVKNVCETTVYDYGRFYGDLLALELAANGFRVDS